MKNKSFDKAYAELQKIVTQLQDDETSIDKLSTQLKKANELVAFCKSKLRAIDAEIKGHEEE